MNTEQVQVTVEGVLISATILVGFLLTRGRRPYGKVKLGIHIFLSLWFSTGFGFIAANLPKDHPNPILWIPVAIMGVAIALQWISGALLVFGAPTRSRVKMHLVSAFVLLAADVAVLAVASVPKG